MSDFQGSMLDMFIFETDQLLEQLEQIILVSEQSSGYSQDAINEIFFRIMHTIKGSSAVMMYEQISKIAHSVEDLFHYLREQESENIEYSILSDIVLGSIDFIKNEVLKIKNGEETDGDAEQLIASIQQFLQDLKGVSKNERLFRSVIHFEEGCEMENIRAFNIVHQLKEFASDIRYSPADIAENDQTAEIIRKEGFQIQFNTECSHEEVRQSLSQILYLRDLQLIELEDQGSVKEADSLDKATASNHHEQLTEQIRQIHDNNNNLERSNHDRRVESSQHKTFSHQTMISVTVNKLDKLMDLIGELVIAESMVTQNPDLQDRELENFTKSARQLRKIVNELQDAAMSIRMVPLSTTFHKMNRIVRDMSKKLKKEVRFEIIGEETEVDKNIIEHISDPLMHLIRNAIDHGIETSEERLAQGKPSVGTIRLEAKNAGGDVLISIKDDGKGLNREKIYQKAVDNGLVDRPEDELSDKEIYSFIFLPGFSTNDTMTEFSGRGVGMDVVSQNIGVVGGAVSVDSVPGQGTVFTFKIPLTLAIVDGMNIRVGHAVYTVPIDSIKESFKVHESDVIRDPDGNEMIMVRGQCYPILRLNELYKVEAAAKVFSDGIMVMVEHDGKELCLFVDELIGQQQVVVKALPDYIKTFKSAQGIAGCTLLGDGCISLILDVGSLIQ